jgi:hypothetical protein
MVHWQNRHILVLTPLLAYLLIVGGYTHPSGGYLLQLFPLFVIWGVQGIFSLRIGLLKRIGIAALWLGAFWQLGNAISWAYSFTLPDTRTIAKEWIEKNIPQGSRFLFDTRVMSPPLIQSYDQIEKFYMKAVELNHYKKEYLALQLEAHPGKNTGYVIDTVKKTFRQIYSLQHQVEEVQKLQDLVEVDGDVGKLKRTGIQYVIVDMDVKEGAIKNNYPGIADFYRNLPVQAELIHVFAPTFRHHHGGTLQIYKL